MKRMLCSMFAAMGLAMFAGLPTALAEDVRYADGDATAVTGAATDTSGSCCDALANECCDEGTGRWIAIGELTFFRYHRADGVRAGTSILGTDDAEFDFEAAPRVTVGYQGADGLGLRARWWDYHHTAEKFGPSIGPNNGITVETYTIDLELYDTIQLNSVWTAEISAGIRVNEFEEVMREFLAYRENDFEGWGGVVGLELKRCLGEGLAAYARVRGAILMDDKQVINFNLANIQNDLLLDTTQGMLEIALGFEANWDLDYNTVAFARFGGEWQNWYNYSSSFDATLGEDAFGGPSDVGFGGVTASLGFAF